jgi:hypothetical protein
MSNIKHGSVIMQLSHPAGISAEAEKALADANAEHVKAVEALGFEVHSHHTHFHGSHTHHHKPAA